MSTTHATRPTARALPPEDSGRVKQRLCNELRTLVDRLREDTSHVDVRLDRLALDVLDALDHVEIAETIDRDHRNHLDCAVEALREHVHTMAQTADSIVALTFAVQFGWYDPDEPEVTD